MKLFPDSRILRLLLSVALLAAVVAAGSLLWLSRNLTTIVQQNLRSIYGPELSLGGVEPGWNRVVIRDLRLRRPGGGPIVNRISIGRVIITPRFKTLLSRRMEIDLLRMENPRLLIEIAPDGRVISPLSPRTPGTPDAHSLPVAIRRIEIDGGELILLDRSSERLRMAGVSNRKEGFHLIRFPDVALQTGPLELPLKPVPLPVTLSLAAPGPGSLGITGTFNPVNLDTALTFALRHWDLTRFRPYYLKPDDLNVTRGFLDGDATVAIAGKRLHAPGSIRLSELRVERSGNQGAFLGMSARLFLATMKDDKGEVDASFLLDGDLTAPRFKVRQSLLEQIGSGLARKLGVPVIADVGEGIITLGKKGIGGIQSLFGGGR